MNYSELKTIKRDDVIKASERLSNLAMNLVYRGIKSRDVSVACALTTNELRLLPAELRKYLPIGKKKDSPNYTYSEKKRSAVCEVLAIKLDDKGNIGLSFDEFVAIVVAKVVEQTEEPIKTAEQLVADAQKAVEAAVKKAFRAGLSKAQVFALVSKTGVVAKGTASEAKEPAKAPELPTVADVANG